MPPGAGYLFLMSGIPAPFIPAIRVALQSQGFPAAMLRDDGTLNAAGLLATAYDEIEYRSGVWPNIRIPTAALLEERAPNPFMQWLKPTLILRGKGQETIIAPLGAHPGGTLIPVALVAVALIGLGYGLAKL